MTRYRGRPKLVMPAIRAVRLHPDAVDRLDGLAHSLRRGPSRVPLRRPDHPDEYTPFFIVGAGRSGSTLVRRLLMERYEVVIPPEMPHLGPLVRAFRRRRFASWEQAVGWYVFEFRRRSDVHVAREDHAGERFDYNLWETLDLDPDRLRGVLTRLPYESRSLAGMVRATYLMSTGQLAPEDPAWGDKTPYTTFHYTRVLRVWPRARFLHLLRDGRDYVASYLEAQHRHERQIGARDAALRWRDAVGTCQRIATLVGDRLQLVRYEDLVHRPREVIGSIGRFLELQERVSVRKVTAEGLGDARMSHHNRIEEPVTARSVGRYEDRLDARQRRITLRLLGPPLRAMGYLVETRSPPVEGAAGR